MKAKPGVVDALNRILTIEVTAVNQYFLQSEIVRNWGYDHLADRLRAVSMNEMKDIEELVKHILYLEGLPNLQRIDVIKAPSAIAMVAAAAPATTTAATSQRRGRPRTSAPREGSRPEAPGEAIPTRSRRAPEVASSASPNIGGTESGRESTLTF